MALTEGNASQTFQAQPEAYPSLRKWLEDVLMEVSSPLKTMQQILIASDEIFTNIASYAYPSTTGKVDVSIAYDRQTQVITLVFRDHGIPFNPLAENRETDKVTPLAERKIGGLGILIVRRMMDTVEYRFENDCNVLTLTKKLNPAMVGQNEFPE